MELKTLRQLHEMWMVNKRLPAPGLCASIPKEYYSDLKDLFSPTTLESIELIRKGERYDYWGYGKRSKKDTSAQKILFEYTPRRQSIVLLLCEMHNL